MSVLARTTQADAAQVSAAASNQIEPVTDTKYTSGCRVKISVDFE